MATDSWTELENLVRPAGAELVLELVILPGEPLSGSIGVRGQSNQHPFQGWIDFMSALNNLCQRGKVPDET
jgi:hypothetical protein